MPNWFKRSSEGQDAYGNEATKGRCCGFLSSSSQPKHVNMDTLGKTGGEEQESKADYFRADPEKRYCFGRLKKWQYICLIAANVMLLFFTIMAPITTEVIVPQMAQKHMDEAKVEFFSLRITEPTDRSMTVSAEGQISGAGPYDGSTKPFVVTVEFKGEVLAEMEMPGQTLVGGEPTEFSLTTVMEIPEGGVFDGFAKDLVAEEEVVWHLTGVTSVTAVVAGIPFSADGIVFDKEITLRGYDGLRQVELLVFDLSKSTPDQVNVDMEIDVFNPSIVSIAPLGVLTFDIFYKDAYMGTLVSNGEVDMNSGENILRMSGVVDPEDIDVANELISRYLSNKSTDVTARAGPTASTVDIYNSALSGLELTTALLGDDIRVIERVEFASMTVTPVDDQFVDFSAASRIFIDNPLGPNSPIDIQQVVMELSLQFQEPGKTGTTTIGGISLGPLDISNGTSTVLEIEIDARMEMAGTNGEPFATFVAQFFNNPTIDLILKGSSDVTAITALGNQQLNGMPIDDAVALTGLNAVPNAELVDFDLPRDHPDGGVEIILNVNLPNPSVASMSLGDISFAVMYEGTFMGQVFASDVSIQPGDNPMTMTGFLLPAEQDLDTAGVFMSNYLTGVDQRVAAQGLPNDDAVQWMQSLMEEMNVAMDFPGAIDLELITSFTVNTLGLSFLEDPDIPLSDVSITATFEMPFDFPVEILSTSEVGTLSYQGQPMARLEMPETEADHNIDTDTINLYATDIPIVPINRDVFANFMATLVNTEGDEAHLDGVLTAKASTAMGLITISGIPVVKPMPLQGMNGFNTPPITISDLQGTGGQCGPHCLNVRVSNSIFNPANVFGALGTLGFGIFSQGKQVGYIVIEDFELQMGQNDYVLDGFYVEDPPGDERCVNFLSNWVKGIDTAMELRGLPELTPNTLLHPALSTMSSQTTLPGLDTPLIEYAKMSFDLWAVISEGAIPTKLEIFNPLEVEISLTRVDFLVYDGDTLMGSILQDLTDNPIVLPPGETTESESMNVVIESGFFSLLASFGDALFSGVDLIVDGEQDLIVEEFRGKAYYRQDPVRAGL